MRFALSPTTSCLPPRSRHDLRGPEGTESGSRHRLGAVVQSVGMKLRADGFDVWVFRRKAGAAQYLLLRASQEKADRWFGGGQFWQVPSDFVGEQSVVEAIRGELERFGLEAQTIWAAEHCYTIYNRRYEDIVHLAVFAAEVGSSAEDPTLGTEHSEFAWLDARETSQRVVFRGLKDGLRWVREYVTEAETPPAELRLL